MQVIIPLAGYGTRLRPHTYSKPKPLVLVAGKPVLGHILDKFVGLNIDEIIFITGYLGEQIEEYVGSEYDFKARYVEQKELKGQAHALRLTRDYVDQPVLILFVDTIFEADLNRLADIEADGIAYVKEVEDPSRFGVVTLEEGYINRFVEKPDEPVSNLAVIGVYFIKDTDLLFECIEDLIQRQIMTKGEYYLADALQMMVERGTRLKAWPVEVWEDAGTVDAILRTNRYFLEQLTEADGSVDNSTVLPPARIPESATVRNSVVGPYVFIGENSTIQESVVGPYVSVGDGGQIRGSVMKDSILDQGARVEGSMLNQSLIGRQARVQDSVGRFNIGDTAEVASYRHE